MQSEQSAAKIRTLEQKGPGIGFLCLPGRQLYVFGLKSDGNDPKEARSGRKGTKELNSHQPE
jgi:hypothetical protein